MKKLFSSFEFPDVSFNNIPTSKVIPIGNNGVFKISDYAINDFIRGDRIEIPSTPKISISAPLYLKFSSILVALTCGNTAKKYTFNDGINDAPKEIQNKMPQIMKVALNDNNMKRLIDMFYDYQRALILKKVVPDLSDTSNENIINIREHVMGHDKKIRQVVDGNMSEDEYFETIQPSIMYMKESKLYAAIPCFNQGILDYSENMSVFWKILNIDLDKQYIDLMLYIYLKPSSQTGLEMNIPVDMQNIRVEYNKEASEKDHLLYDIYRLSAITLSGLYQVISPKKFRWSQSDRLLWNNVIIKFTKLMDFIANEYGDGRDFGSIGESSTEHCASAITCFCNINHVLHNRKRRTRKRSSNHEKKEINSFDEKKQEERKVTTIDGITFYSIRPPREMTRQTVVKYSVASWTVRGHTRTYKDGHKVYIKEHVNRRKNMSEVSKPIAPAPRTIDIKTKI